MAGRGGGKEVGEEGEEEGKGEELQGGGRERKKRNRAGERKQKKLGKTEGERHPLGSVAKQQSFIILFLIVLIC